MPIIMVEWGLGMNAKILALLFTIVALTGTAGAAQGCSGKTFNASALGVIAVECHPNPPPVAARANYNPHGVVTAS